MAALQELLERNRIPGFDANEFLDKYSKYVTIALAFSGGGYRSMLTGGGALVAYDSRTPGTDSKGQLGGLFQASSYIGGISGGSWLVMSNLINDNRPIIELKDDPKAWSLQHKLLEGIPNFDPASIQKTQSDQSPLVPSSNGYIYDNHDNETKEKNPFAAFFSKIFNFAKIFPYEKEDTHLDQKEQSTLTSSVLDLLKSILLKNDEEDHDNSTEKIPENTVWKKVFSYYKELNIEVRSKRSAGYYVSFTDYWGRALARRIFPGVARIPGVTITESTSLPSFKNYEQPFPVIGTIEKTPSKSLSSVDSHLFEFTPYEFGSWDDYLGAFVPLRYLGSSLYNGVPIQPTKISNVSICVSGYDNVGYMTGASSCLFSHIFVYIYNFLVGFKLELSVAANSLLTSFGLSAGTTSLNNPQYHPDYALISPNPFYGFKPAKDTYKELSESTHMYLVDGGDDGQNIPFQPFIQPSREVDIIFAFDMTSDHNNFPNGTTLRKSIERYHSNATEFSVPYFEHSDQGGGQREPILTQRSAFPSVPTPEDIVYYNLSLTPIFLGCDLDDFPAINVTTLSSAFSGKTSGYLPPLIIYTANSAHTFQSNTSTFQLSYTPYEVNKMIENGYSLATNGNSTSYSTCVSCAILKRQFDHITANGDESTNDSFSVPEACKACFQQYCWKEKYSKSISHKADLK